MKKMKNKQAIKASKLAKAKNMQNKIITVKNAEGEPDTKAEILIQNKIGYTPKVSVIIPVYNVEEYLRECLDSVVNQTLKEIEIICVDDGSTDNSLEILKEYAKKDNRITVITQQNLHAGVARNAGLAVAKGEYLSFLDSDDFFELNMLEETYNKAKNDNAEIIIFGNYVYDQTKLKDIRKTTYLEKFLKKSPFSPEEFSNDLFLISNPNAWTKLFKSKTVKENNVFFENYISCNDITFVNTMLTLAKKISLTNNPYVHYRINTKINISADRGGKASCFIYAVKKLENNLRKHQKYEIYKKSLETRIDKSFNWELNQCNEQQKVDLKNLSIKILGKDYTQQPKVSVIIPVYNTAEFLPQCLDSVINQTLKDIEIICVDDGSTDNSLQILQEYAKKDDRIIVLTQENQKQGAARNKGLSIAKGEYIQFVDSDDYLVKDACEKLYNKSSKLNLDMLNFEGINFDEYKQEQARGQTIYYIQSNEEKDVYYNKELDDIKGQIPISACRFFYNKKFIVDNNILFPEKVYFEDNYFVMKSIILVKRYGIMRDILYYRRVHKNSTTQNWNKHFSDYIKIVLKINEMFKQYDNIENFSKKKIKTYTDSVIRKYNSFIPKDKKKYEKEMRKFMHELGIKENNIVKTELYKTDLQNWYRRATGQYLNLDNPRTFNEKIQWLKLYDSTPLKTRLADKYLVRDWVKEKIGEQYLIPLLGVYDKFEDIDFAKLPNQFVIKCNHGCAYNIIVKDKSKLDLAEAKAKLDKWMSENFAFKAGYELHYRDIKPRIIIEKFIENKGTDDLYDYKFWCFNGKLAYIQFLSERNLSGLKMAFYDRKWNKQTFVYSHPLDKKTMKKPDNLDEMIQLAEALSKGFPCVRVDFYRLNDGTIYFGEMTFTSASGNCKWNDEHINRALGNMIKLPKLAYNIDTGEYYKLPKKSKLKPWLLLPYNLLKQKYLQEKYQNAQCQSICRQLKSIRIDIKNFGKAENSTDIATAAKVSHPAWFANEQGQGCIAESCGNTEKLAITCRGAGKLRLEFRGSDKRFDGTRFPLWIDYKSIKINGKEQLTAPVATWHDKPYRFEMPVKDGQVVTVEVLQQYHQYAKDELQDVILKLNPNSDYIRQNINRLTDKIYDKITVKPAAPRVKKPKAASNQELLASIAALNARIERLEQENRDRQAQLLAAINTLKKS